MPAYKDGERGTWLVSFYYDDWTGKRLKKMKRGFKTRKAALEWEREFLLEKSSDMNMEFETFIELYTRDKRNRLKESTVQTKEIIQQKLILPYFGKKRMCEIQPRDVIEWQNMLLAYRDENGKPYSPAYLKTVHNQLSAIFNHAVRYYGLRTNPARLAGNMGKDGDKEMLYWTKEEYLKFAEAMMDKPTSYYAFELLYWCGIREGELLALTAGDFDLEKGTLSITKTFQHIKGRDFVTDPKTPASRREIIMSPFLVNEMKDYLSGFYKPDKDQRIFEISKSYLQHEMRRGAAAAGVKQIRVHDLRHSHVSLLIHMGFTVLAIGKRMGHSSEKITTRYAHLFPSVQTEMAEKLEIEHLRKEDNYGESTGPTGALEK